MDEMGLRLELRRSQLSERDFAKRLGVDIERLRYWIQFEEYRKQLELRYPQQVKRSDRVLPRA